MDYLKEERKKRNRRKRLIRRITMTIMTNTERMEIL